MTDRVVAETISFASNDGDQIEGYLATPDDPPRGGVVVIHHMPGYDWASKEITRRFATLGFVALCPNLHFRDAPGAAPDDAAAASRANGGVPDDRLVADVGAAADLLRSMGAARIGTIGYCSGGRQSVLAACSLPLDAAVDCYGAFVVGTPPDGWPVKMDGLEALLPDLSAPLLGLFGAEDKTPSPADVATLTELLDRHGKDFTPVSYDDAGHGFFAVDRPAYRVAAASDGWERIEAFFGRHLTS